MFAREQTALLSFLCLRRSVAGNFSKRQAASRAREYLIDMEQSEHIYLVTREDKIRKISEKALAVLQVFALHSKG